MAKSGLRGPFVLNRRGVDNEVTTISAGAYALGDSKEDGFHIKYVGRADDDVASRLRDHIPEPYQNFKYEYYPSAKAAFEKECRLYHDFNPADNQIHPARPQNTNYKCPVCGA